MKFGAIELDRAVGAILAHGVRHGDGLFKKGRVLSKDDVKALQAAGHKTVTAAFLDADDVAEDIAAHRVAVAACGVGMRAQAAFTGRANLHSAAHGLVIADEARIGELNHLHEGLTLATLANFSRVEPRQMVATVKVIPFAIPKDILDRALAIIGTQPLLRVAAFQARRAGLVITRLPQTKPSLIAKSENAIRDRMTALGGSLDHVLTCEHTAQAVSEAVAKLRGLGCDPVLLFGASAIVDRADVIPAGLIAAGGEVIHLGMPVDPGNLLMLGRLQKVPVLGVPSCARSPKTNGFDWVLERLVAGLEVRQSDIMDMGTGGLLAEIPSRPSPREPRESKDRPSHSPRVAAVVLAAGTSVRMGSNKLLADFRGVPLLRATVEAIRKSSVDEIVVVTGHEPDRAEAALAGLGVRLVHNPDYAQGLAASLRCGVRAVAETAEAVVICLADMPLIDGKLIDRLIAAFNPTEHRTIIVPTHRGQFGNPVLWGAEHFERLQSLSGDRGARSLIGAFKSDAVEIEAGNDSVLRDVDTPEALALLR